MLYTERDLEIAMVGNGLIETTPALLNIPGKGG